MRLYELLRKVYSPKYVALNVAAFAVYYLAATSIAKFSSGVVIFAPYSNVLFYAVLATASVLLTLSVYSIQNTRRNAAKYSASLSGTFTAIGGGLFLGCGCQAPILFSVFSLFVGSANALGADVFISDYELPLLLALLFINAAIISYYLYKLSRPECSLPTSRRKRR
ncbi:hypothetical protein M1329_01790 [Candidatus Marsarchaeota archaeon]|jgi:hypothetical protein|nr:hypothetical protein [Candidatus Marsarchaeota archaeon]MCL5100071.1 hypothetical protein [Candidatus Marsarchaeota archaeon]